MINRRHREWYARRTAFYNQLSFKLAKIGKKKESEKEWWEKNQWYAKKPWWVKEQEKWKKNKQQKQKQKR